MQNASASPEDIELCVQVMGKENAVSSLFTALAIDNQEILQAFGERCSLIHALSID